jgi:zinc protease
MTTNDLQAQQLAPRLHKSVLENGLTVISRETPGTGVATVQIWVNAGSVYEEPHEAGITHLIEHMIFKGTPTLGIGGVAGAIEAVGGRINAYTSFEHTVYHATLDARHWSLAMDVLADAVLNSLFDAEELEREKPVIFEEIRMRKDRPELHLFQELLARAYTTHPYRLPISGSEESVGGISRQDILAYHERHYHPENFTIVVVGDVDAAAVLAQSRRLFGELPRSPVAERDLPPEPAQDDFRFFLEEQSINQTHLALAFPIPAFRHPDTAALNVLAHILGQGEASRLYERLRHEQGLVYRVNSSLFSSRDPGLFHVGATLDAVKSREVLREIMTEILALQHFPVSEQELERAKRNLEADFVFNLERAEGMARVLGNFELLTGDPREHDYLERIRAVDTSDIIRVAAAHLQPSGLTAGLLAPEGANIALDQAELAALLQSAAAEATRRQPRPGRDSTLPPHTSRFRLDNGITLLVREQRDVPTVAVRAVFPGGLRGETPATNGAFAFISELLPRGTATMDSRQIARAVADMAGEIDGFNGKNTFGLQGDFLSRFFDQGLILLRDIIREPAFAPEEAERVRVELLANLRRQEDSLPTVGFREFNRLLFRGHPYALNTAGAAGAIQGLTVEGLREIYEQYARPDKLVLAVVGDVDAEGVKLQVEELFGDWRLAAPAEAAVAESLLPPEPPSRPELVNISRDREQVHIIIGFLGTTLSDPDRYALEILDQVLSGQSGRLFAELRDRRSLAYSLSSFSLLGLDTGAFGVYIGTSPDRREEAVKELWSQIYRVRSEPISPAELERARNVLVSNYRLGLQSNGARAMEMALNETYGLGLDFADRYPALLEATSAALVQNAARRYLQPERYVMVTVGNSEDRRRPAAEEEPAGNPGPEADQTAVKADSQE